MSVVAELANLPGLESTPVIILTQVQQKEIVKISILVEEVDGKITHISFCAIPDPHSALLSGIVPFWTISYFFDPNLIMFIYHLQSK